MPGALANSAREVALRHAIETYKVDLDTMTLERDEDGGLLEFPAHSFAAES